MKKIKKQFTLRTGILLVLLGLAAGGAAVFGPLSQAVIGTAPDIAPITAPSGGILPDGTLRPLETSPADYSAGVQIQPNNPTGLPGTRSKPVPKFSGGNVPWIVNTDGPLEIVDDLRVYGFTDIREGLVSSDPAGIRIPPPPPPAALVQPTLTNEGTPLGGSITTNHLFDNHVATFRFLNNAAENIKITQIDLKLEGSLQDVASTSIPGLELRNLSNLDSLVKVINYPNTNMDPATKKIRFDLAAAPLILQPGTPLDLGIKINLWDPSRGKDMRFSIESQSDVIMDPPGYKPEAVYPVSGNLFTVNTVSVDASVAADTPGAAEIAPGQTDIAVAKFRFTANNDTVDLTGLFLKINDNIDPSQIENVKLCDSAGTNCVTADLIDPNPDSRTAGFWNFGSVFSFAANSSGNIIIKTTLKSTATQGKTISFSINSAGDILSSAFVVNGAFPLNGNTFTVAALPPTNPTGLTATAAGTTQINLSWTASTDNVGVTGYQVERCTAAGCTNFAQIATPTLTSYNDTGLAAGTTYEYRVRALDADANMSGYSDAAGASTPDGTPPTAPTGLTATAAGTTQINLSWTASTDAVGVTGYQLERCSGASCTTFAQIGTPVTTTYPDTGLTESTAYRYQVRAADAAGNLSGYSNIANATTFDITPPTAPTNLAATPINATQINLSWTASTDNAGVTGYQLERCTGFGCTSWTQIATPTTTSYSNTGLIAATTYIYRVRAVDAAANLSAYSSTASASTFVSVLKVSPSTSTPAGGSVAVNTPSYSTYKFELSGVSGTFNVTQIRLKRTGTATLGAGADITGVELYDVTTGTAILLGLTTTFSGDYAILPVTLAVADGTTKILEARAIIGNTGPTKTFSFGINEESDITLASGKAAVYGSGNLMNTPSWISGHEQFGLSFNGTNQYVEISDQPALDLGTATVTAWINPPSNYNKAFINKEASYELGIHSDGTFIAAFRPAVNNTWAWIDSDAVIPLNTWSHLAATYDGTNVSFYINGVLQTTKLNIKSDGTPNGGTLRDSAYPLRFAARDGNTDGVADNFAPTSLDDITIYNRVLSASEISSVYSSASRPITNLAGWWKFNEGSGVSTEFISTNAPVNGNTMTIIGPDLTIASSTDADTVKRPTATSPILIGQAATFTAYVKSIGTIAPTATSYARLSIDTDNDGIFETGEAIGDVATGSGGTFHSGTGGTIYSAAKTWTWTPTSTGNFNAQFCADATGTVPESNDGASPPGNNCEPYSFTVVAPTLNVELDSTNPAAGNVLLGSNSNNALIIKFTATNAAVTINQLKIKLTGTATNTEFDRLRLVEGATVLAELLNPSILDGSGIATFTGLSKTVNPGTSAILKILPYIGSNTASVGRTYTLGINAATDITTASANDAKTATPSFPVNGYQFTIVQATLSAAVSTSPATPAAANVYSGQQDKHATYYTLTATNGTVSVRSIKVTKTSSGTATSDSHITSVQLFDSTSGGTQRGSTAGSLDASGTATFSTSSGTGFPFSVTPGTPITMRIETNVSTSATDDTYFGLGIANPSTDIGVSGGQTVSGTTAVNGNMFHVLKPKLTVAIDAGTPPSNNLALGSTANKVASIRLTAADGPVQMNNIRIRMPSGTAVYGTEVTNITLKESGISIGTRTTSPSTCTSTPPCTYYNFSIASPYLVINAGSSKIIDIYADITTNTAALGHTFNLGTQLSSDIGLAASETLVSYAAAGNTFTIGLPDLIIQSVTAPGGSFTAGNPYNFSAVVKNQGQAVTARTTDTRFLIDYGPTSNPPDGIYELYEDPTSPPTSVLNATATETENFTVDFPWSLLSYTLYYKVCADMPIASNGKVWEGTSYEGETSNCTTRRGPISVGPGSGPPPVPVPGGPGPCLPNLCGNVLGIPIFETKNEGPSLFENFFSGGDFGKASVLSLKEAGFAKPLSAGIAKAAELLSPTNFTLLNPVTIYDDLFVRGGGTGSLEPGNLTVSGRMESRGNISTDAILKAKTLNVGPGPHQIVGNLQINTGDSGVTVAGGNLSIVSGMLKADSIGKFNQVTGTSTSVPSIAPVTSTVTCPADDELIGCYPTFNPEAPALGNFATSSSGGLGGTCTVSASTDGTGIFSVAAKAICFSPDG